MTGRPGGLPAASTSWPWARHCADPAEQIDLPGRVESGVPDVLIGKGAGGVGKRRATGAARCIRRQRSLSGRSPASPRAGRPGAVHSGGGTLHVGVGAQGLLDQAAQRQSPSRCHGSATSTAVIESAPARWAPAPWTPPISSAVATRSSLCTGHLSPLTSGRSSVDHRRSFGHQRLNHQCRRPE